VEGSCHGGTVENHKKPQDSQCPGQDTSQKHYRLHQLAQFVGFETLLPTCFMLVSCLAYSSSLKMAICSSEILVDFEWTIWYYILEDRNLAVLKTMLLLLEGAADML
jgi:hypothetical protein